MKKTKATFLTAAALTVAAAASPDLCQQSLAQEAEAMSTVYGPPSILAAKGDVNEDGDVNILDYCLARSAANGEGNYSERDISDINRDGKIDKSDMLSFQQYLFGKTDKVVPYSDEEQVQPVYGCYDTGTTVTTIEDTATQKSQTTITGTLPTETDITDYPPQPVYGCYTTYMEQTDTEATTTQVPQSEVTTTQAPQSEATTTQLPQSKITLPTETTLTDHQTQAVYGCYNATEDNEVK